MNYPMVMTAVSKSVALILFTTFYCCTLKRINSIPAIMVQFTESDVGHDDVLFFLGVFLPPIYSNEIKRSFLEVQVFCIHI